MKPCIKCGTIHSGTSVLCVECASKGKDKPSSVNHPPHYNSHPSGIECIEIVQHMNFCLGNAFKYIWRAGSKGDTIEDLNKAIFYINQEIARLTKCSTS